MCSNVILCIPMRHNMINQTDIQDLDHNLDNIICSKHTIVIMIVQLNMTKTFAQPCYASITDMFRRISFDTYSKDCHLQGTKAHGIKIFPMRTGGAKGRKFTPGKKCPAIRYVRCCIIQLSVTFINQVIQTFSHQKMSISTRE